MAHFAIVKRDRPFSGIVVSLHETAAQRDAAYDALVPDDDTQMNDPHICVDHAENYPVGSRCPT